jgi:chromosome segregation ATPase
MAQSLRAPTGVRFRVIEALMFSGLGFLVAALIALLIIPAVNARAERLARRRVEALFPLSITELTAEKDHLRAEFAVLQRRLERKAEEALANKHQDMEELGRRAVRIEALEGEIAARDHRIGELEGDLERTRAQLVATEGELAVTRQTLAASRETQAALDTAHRRTLDELALTRGSLENTTAALAETRTALAATEQRLARRDAEFGDLDMRHTATLNELDAKRINISDLETRLGTQKSRGDELEHALSQRQAELSQERQRIADLAQSLLAEQGRAATLQDRIRTLEAEHESRTSQWAALEADMRAERDTLFARAEERRQAFESSAAKLRDAESRIAELEAGLRQQTDGGSGDQSLAETVELRRRIEEVADEIMRVSETAEEPPQRSRSVG